MLRMLCYVLLSTCILLTTTALPVAVANKKDSKFCCKCTVEGDESTGETVTNLGNGLINTVNLLTGSLAGCGGGLTATVISGADGGFINSGGGGLIGTHVGGSSIGLVPSIKIRVPQVQFPAPFNIIPQQQYLLYNLQPLQSSFFNIQQPKVTTQCCMPCPDGNGICCCTPGEITTVPRDSSPNHSAGAQTPLKNISLLVSMIALLALDQIL